MIRRRRVAIFGGVLLLLIFRGSAAAVGDSWRELLARADGLSDEGKNDEAVKAAQDALADADKSLGPEAPETGRILSHLSRFYATTGDDSQVAEIKKRLLAVKSKDFDVWAALGILLRNEGKSIEAEDALKKAVALNPNDPAAEYQLALVYDDTGRFEEEIRLLKMQVKKRPQDFLLYFQLASTYARLGRFTEAKEIFAQAKKSDGRNAAAYAAEGYFYLRSGHPLQAKAAFENTIAVDTANAGNYHHMGTFYLENRQYPEAEEYFRRALKMMEADPNIWTKVGLPETLIRLGAAIEAQGRYPEAEAIYLKALEKTRGNDAFRLSVLQRLANLYAAQGKSDAVEETYKRALAESPMRVKSDFSYAYGALMIDLGRFYLGQGRRAEAEAMAERAEKFAADAPVKSEFFNLLRNLLAFYAKLGDVSKNEALYARLMPLRRMRPLDPELVWVERGLADIDAAQGRLHEAENLDRSAIEMLDHNARWKEEADFLDNLAGLYEKEGKSRRAADEAREQAKSLRTRQ